ncbi:MAG: GIY-YIG nuclease family protein [bacterium]|nr:GIY-YIG nuclease family protein [bacterium]
MKCPELVEGLMYYLYLIKCKDGSIYTGISSDVEKRFTRHSNKQGSKYTIQHQPEEIIYIEAHINKTEAARREKQIKGWRREKKLGLVNK